MNLNKTILYSFTLLLVSYSAIGNEANIKAEHKVQIEYQTKTVLQNNADKDINTSWDKENAQLFQGNIGFGLNLWNHHFKGNAFFRVTESPLIEDQPETMVYSLYPNTVVGRDLFKLFHSKTDTNQSQYAALNQFEYEWGDDELSFKAGRMIIDFGHGEFFNPINPFNFVSSLSNTHETHSGNDGLQFKINREEDLALYVYILGDKSFTEYDKKITRTLVIRGDWKINKELNLNYILGEDQKRHKYGVELAKTYNKNMIFAQLLRFSQRLDNESPDDEGIAHSLIGAKAEVNDKWSLLIELGAAKKPEDSTEKLDLRYLPFERFIALQNRYQFSERLDLKVGIIADPDSEASLYKSDLSYKTSKTLSVKTFASGPMSTPNEKDDNIATLRKIPYEIGLSLIANF